MRTVLGTMLAAMLLAGCAKRSPEEHAMTPQESLRAMRLSDDFHVELFAAEPDVMSPVEMAFDENGKIYVAEMMDYPEDPPAGKPARRASGSSKIPTATARPCAARSSPTTCSPSAGSCRGRAG